MRNVSKRILRRVFGSRLDPCLAEINELRKTFADSPRYTPGRMAVFGWDIEFLDGLSLVSSLEVLVCKRWNDFVSDTDAPVILDCGANIGISVLNYKRRYPEARIIAFEPDPNFIPVLRRNLERNGAGDVDIVEAAVWTSNGQVSLLLEGADGSRICPRGHDDVDPVVVRSIRLTDYITEPVDLLKLDIEGAEFAVVCSLGDDLRYVKSLIVECHINIDEIGDFASLLGCLGSASFEVAINSFGAWRDLLRQPERLPNSFDQYVLVAARYVEQG